MENETYIDAVLRLSRENGASTVMYAMDRIRNRKLKLNRKISPLILMIRIGLVAAVLSFFAGAFIIHPLNRGIAEASIWHGFLMSLPGMIMASIFFIIATVVVCHELRK